jgi:Arc/MetJ-type ribon-helix-helix transcriptional regulator
VAKVEVRDEIYEEIKKRVEESEDFSSVEEYVNFVLEEILKDKEEEEVVYSEEEEKQVKERLRGLGYL